MFPSFNIMEETMKKTAFALLLLSSFTFAQEKIYLNHDEICIQNEIITVQVNDSVFEVDTLQCDQGGLFVEDKALRCHACRRPYNPKHLCSANL